MGQGSRVKGQGKVVAIVPAAGLGKRFGEGSNKPFYSLLGKPLLVWTLEALQGVDEIDEIIPVLKESDLITGGDLMDSYHITKVRRIVPGGRERQDSIYNALKSLDDSTAIVVIHDGARPLVDVDLIKRAIAGLLPLHPPLGKGGQRWVDGVIAAVPVKDTIKEVHGSSLMAHGKEEVIVKKTLNRNVLWSVQTPQVFRLQKLREVYEKAFADKHYATDDAALIERYGGKIKIVMGSYSNIKITTPEDINIAEALIAHG